jgi:nucleoside-diphosphate-sugar epimerase
MKVLLLGLTGNVGSRLLPSLVAHNHQVVAFIRSPTKISKEAKLSIDTIVVGSASDSDAIKKAILDHGCDAVVNAAGVAAMTGFTSQGEFPAIFAAVVKATSEASKERGGAPIRCWLLSGFAMLDGPKNPYLLTDL